MSSERSTLLAQIPLTVSPFITLPKAPTLPHNYTSLPPTLPPSCITPPSNPHQSQSQNQSQNQERERGDVELANYITSPSGAFATHPSTLIAQNSALLHRLHSGTVEAEQKVLEWEEGIKQRELKEKRRTAPGWLDREEKILEPERGGGGGGRSGTGGEARGEGGIKARGGVGLDGGDGVKGKEKERDLLGEDDPTEAMGQAGLAERTAVDLGAQMDRAFGPLG